MIDIQEIVRNHIKVRDEEQSKRAIEPREIFHPSTSSGCPRQIFLSKINAKIFSEEILSKMASGTIIHKWIQNIAEIKENFDVEKPVEALIPNSQAYFKGSADIVAKDDSFVWDIKSIASFYFIETAPMQEHKIQLNVYMKGLGATGGQLLYVDKTSLKMLPYTFMFDQALYDQTCAKVRMVYEALLKWENEGAFNNPIPFSKCQGRCYGCEKEIIRPEILKLMR